MHSLAACPCEKSPFASKTIAPSSSNSPLHHQSSTADLLAIARQVARNAQFGEWEAHQLEQYFGPESRSLPFKEILLPFIWAARQQLISQVGDRYHRLTLPQRAQRELGLLVKLNTEFQRAFRKADNPKLISDEISTEMDFKTALNIVFEQFSPLALNMVEITSHWIDSTVKLLDIL